MAGIKLEIDPTKFIDIRIIADPAHYDNGYYVFSRPIFSMNFKFAILKVCYFMGENFLWAKHYVYKIERNSLKEMKIFCQLTG